MIEKNLFCRFSLNCGKFWYQQLHYANGWLSCKKCKSPLEKRIDRRQKDRRVKALYKQIEDEPRSSIINRRIYDVQDFMQRCLKSMTFDTATQ